MKRYVFPFALVLMSLGNSCGSSSNPANATPQIDTEKLMALTSDKSAGTPGTLEGVWARSEGSNSDAAGRITTRVSISPTQMIVGKECELNDEVTTSIATASISVNSDRQVITIKEDASAGDASCKAEISKGEARFGFAGKGTVLKLTLPKSKSELALIKIGDLKDVALEKKADKTLK